MRPRTWGPGKARQIVEQAPGAGDAPEERLEGAADAAHLLARPEEMALEGAEHHGARFSAGAGAPRARARTARPRAA